MHICTSNLGLRSYEDKRKIDNQQEVWPGQLDLIDQDVDPVLVLVGMHCKN